MCAVARQNSAIDAMDAPTEQLDPEMPDVKLAAAAVKDNAKTAKKDEDPSKSSVLMNIESTNDLKKVRRKSVHGSLLAIWVHAVSGEYDCYRDVRFWSHT